MHASGEVPFDPSVGQNQVEYQRKLKFYESTIPKTKPNFYSDISNNISKMPKSTTN